MPTPLPVRPGAARLAGWRPPPRTSGPARWCATARWSRAGRRWWRSRKLFPRDTTAASSALFLLGDLASDDQADRLARTYYRRAALRYPTSRFAAAARFRAAMVELLTGDAAMAGREFDELARRYPRSDEAPASVYWAGRAWSLAGDSVKAPARWRKATQGDPASYYASLAARRLGVPAWAPVAGGRHLRPGARRRLGRVAAPRCWPGSGSPPSRAGSTTASARRAEESTERMLAVANALRLAGTGLAGDPARPQGARQGRPGRRPHVPPDLSGGPPGRAAGRGGGAAARSRASWRRSFDRSPCSIPRPPRRWGPRPDAGDARPRRASSRGRSATRCGTRYCSISPT